MTDAIIVELNTGRIAYDAWCQEFCDQPYDDWDELTQTTQDAWESIAEAVVEDRIQLPEDGTEVIIRNNAKILGFAWVGQIGTEMQDIMLTALMKVMGARDKSNAN